MDTFWMDNKTLEHNSWLPLLNIYIAVVTQFISLVIRLPINIFILEVILSKRLISSETYAFREAVFQIIISLYDVFSIASIFHPHRYLLCTWFALEVVLVIGHPIVLTAASVERYLAVVKPLLYLRLKPSKCGLPLGGLICLWTLAFFTVSLFRKLFFSVAVIAQNTACCGIQLYCFAVMIWALKQPSPVETGGKEVRMSAMKLRAVKIILWSVVRTLLVYTPLTLICTLNVSVQSSMRQWAIVSQICYAIGSLVDFFHALIFLQRTGEITFIQCL